MVRGQRGPLRLGRLRRWSARARFGFAANLARLPAVSSVHTQRVHDGAGGHDTAGGLDRETLDVRLQVADGGARLRVAGPFTARTAGTVRAALELVSVAAAVVEVDLSRVTRIDDDALDLLASARRAARREGWVLVLAGGRGRDGVAQPSPACAPGAPSAPAEAGPVGPAASRTIVTNRTSNPARS